MKIEFTQRGFARIEFTDQCDERCSVQDSSIADGPCIWLGVDTVNVEEWRHIPGADLRAIPARMHLNQDMAAQLIPMLQRFVETGSVAQEY